MTIPVYKIETWTGAVQDYTITEDAFNIGYTDVLTDGVGTFHFDLPTTKGTGSTFLYNDIALHDKVKIWLNYDVVGANPSFVGRITSISAPLQTPSGYVRTISGLSLGAVLLRRFKTNRFYNAEHADDIVTEIIDNLSTADDLAHDHTKTGTKAVAETIEVRSKTYFDLLQEVSDYYVDGTANDVKFDFYVDVGGVLYWKARPIRTVGVETFTVGQNIVSYNVTRDINAVRNSITVYGSSGKLVPETGDAWTQNSLTDWSSSNGVVNFTALDPHVGSWNIKGTTNGSGHVTIKHDNFGTLSLRSLSQLRFHRKYGASTTAFTVRIHAPDSSNYFSSNIHVAPGTWTYLDLPLGPKEELDTNEEGFWTKVSTPNWWNIKAVEFDADGDDTIDLIWIDGLHFATDQYSSGIVSDPTSILTYGQRDLEITDDKQHSDAQCLNKADTLLYQLKDPTTQIEIITPGNTNILIGDRLSMTIPAEAITTTNYDVIKVEHSLNSTGYQTRAVMVNSGNIRQEVESLPFRILSNFKRILRKMNRDEQIR